MVILGGVAWIRKSSRFYKSLTKRNGGNIIIAFYTPQFPLSEDKTSPSFIETINSASVNYIVEDIYQSGYSKIKLGDRIFVEESVADIAVIATVIAKETINTSNGIRYKLTARLDFNGSDIVLEDKNAWLLPSQLGHPGKFANEYVSIYTKRIYKSRMKRINHTEKENFSPSFGIVQFMCKTFCIRRRFILHLILLIQT